MKLPVLWAILLLAGSSSMPPKADGSRLRPPDGASVAIVMFEDLQCPDCARAYPLVYDAAKSHNVPLVIHEFPLPQHNWAFAATVYARFFAGQPGSLADDFRRFIYENQSSIDSGNLRSFAERFAGKHVLALPDPLDPEEIFKKQVEADYKLGEEVELQYTPTIFVLGSGDRFVEVDVKARPRLGEILEEMKKATGTKMASSNPRAIISNQPLETPTSAFPVR